MGLTGRRDVYEREMALEVLRRVEFPDKVSRLTGFYCFAEQRTATEAANRWGPADWPTEQLAEIALLPGL